MASAEESAGGRVGVDAVDRDDLGPAGGSSLDPHRRPGHLEPLGKEPDQGLVGRSVDRRGGEPDTDRVAVRPRYLGARSPRLHAHTETDAGRRWIDQRYDSTKPRTRVRTSQATSGLKSSMPTGGRMRRIGWMSQSVSAMATRIHGR
jgi:hypothetical protein